MKVAPSLNQSQSKMRISGTELSLEQHWGMGRRGTHTDQNHHM